MEIIAQLSAKNEIATFGVLFSLCPLPFVITSPQVLEY